MQRQAIQIILIVAISGHTHFLNGQVNDAIREYLSSYEASLNNLSDVSFPQDDRQAFRLDIEDKYYTENTMIYNHLFKEGVRNLKGYEYVEKLLVDYNEPIRHHIQAEKSLSTDPYKPVIVVKYTLSKGNESKVDQFQFTIDVRMLGRGVFKGKILSMMPYEELADRGEKRKEADRKSRERRAEASAWTVAKRRNTKAGYEEYLADYPDGGHVSEARSRINDIDAGERAAAQWQASLISLAEKAAEEITSTMVEIAGGTFTMGCTAEQGDDCSDNERPAHEVYLSGFQLNKFEVTQWQWRAIMGSDPESLWNPGCDRCPVERVTWDDAQKFIRKLNRVSGSNYRLPTEAEWEYAARGGQQSRGYKYSGSDSIGEVAWYEDNAEAGNTHGSRGTTHPVSGKRPNELGLYGMSGNVSEWCADRFASDYYEQSPRNNPGGPSSGLMHVLRGGSWRCGARKCRVSWRTHFSPGSRSNRYGFRLAR